MGLLLKAGINIDLIKSALISFFTITFFVLVINFLPFLKKRFPNYSLQLGGLIGNTSFLGIPIAIALLPTNTINFTIGYDLGTTLFSWIFGPFLLKESFTKNSSVNFKNLFLSIFSSPASKGIVGVLIVYLFNVEDVLGDLLRIPTKIIISLAIIIVGTRLGIILNNKKFLFKFGKEIKLSITLKLVILPLITYFICSLIGFNKNEITALVLQAATPTAISTILMSEAFKINQDTAAKILFTTTIFSIFSIPFLVLIIY